MRGMTAAPPTPPKKPSFVLGNSKTFSLPMYGLMAGGFACLIIAALAFWAPSDRFAPGVDALVTIVTLMLGLAGAGGITLGARDMVTKGVTSSNSEAAVRAIEATKRPADPSSSKP